MDRKIRKPKSLIVDYSTLKEILQLPDLDFSYQTLLSGGFQYDSNVDIALLLLQSLNCQPPYLIAEIAC